MTAALWTTVGLLGVALTALVARMIYNLNRIERRIDRLEERLDQRMDRLEVRMERLETILMSILQERGT